MSDLGTSGREPQLLASSLSSQARTPKFSASTGRRPRGPTPRWGAVCRRPRWHVRQSKITTSPASKPWVLTSRDSASQTARASLGSVPSQWLPARNSVAPLSACTSTRGMYTTTAKGSCARRSSGSSGASRCQAWLALLKSPSGAGLARSAPQWVSRKSLVPNASRRTAWKAPPEWRNGNAEPSQSASTFTLSLWEVLATTSE
mmetsp:Transcript_100923/g.301085  ORF Transcript_100923/g.301085 Transcript_100923/m.301085 type:complete len:203 (+) Transcript_100923:116-724(+)